MPPKKISDKKAGGNDKKSKGDDKKKLDANSGDPSRSKVKGSLKPATAINVRHILCEKHSKVMEALSKLQVGWALPKSCMQEGQKFDKVAQEYSEDKAKGDFE
ncbi:hypothetical protein Clacol_009250 [Clathrus columnatus]|uniref:peptidylprolyl isomerase n=1 Tax=Clathrus columnatus TaxID=1419009 RepID=A0AAV5ASV1_9AGAM|nr:hypothetical protein Clacol_009250 [Clathrus columnatus]